MALLLIFLFASMVLGSLTIGAYSIRVYMTVLMSAYLLFYGFNAKDPTNSSLIKFLKAYLVLILLTVISLVCNNEFSSYNFIKRFFAYYLNCIVVVLSIMQFVKSKRDITIVLFFLLICSFINNCISYLQFIGNPVGNAIALFFTTSSELEAYELIDKGAVLFGSGLPVGLFGYVHTNAIYVAILGLLSFVFLLDNISIGKQIILFFILGAAVYTSYFIQERAAFFLFGLSSIYFFFRGRFPSYLKVIVILCVIILLIKNPLSTFDLGRLHLTADSADELRNSAWEDALIFLKDNIIFGGPVAFSKINNVGCHNYFLNAFINCGLLGGILAIVLYFWMLLQAVVIFKQKRETSQMVLAVCVIICLLISLFHNASIISGDFLIFLVFSLMLKSSSLSNYENSSTIKEACC